VIIPTLNEAGSILASLKSVQQESPHEVIVVDGGSADATCPLAADSGARIVVSKARRATQMNAGAARATGDLLLFLHADTTLPRLWSRLVAGALGSSGVSAGAFGFAIAADFSGKRIVEWGTNWRSRRRQMPYGDQALFLRRELFEEEGGFADLPIMEDYEFVRRLRRRGRIVTLAERAITSGRRWQQLGVFRTTLRNQLMIAGYHLGICPDTLASAYRRATRRKR
jgi:rSAM/selenodomain-associated transferase 2